MALIACSECGKEISDKATACPNCGVPIKKTVEKKKEGVGCLSFIVVAAVLAVLLAFCGQQAEREDTPERRRAETCSTNGAFSAWYYSKEFATRELKAPKTAEFPSFGDNGVTSTWAGDCDFNVVPYVDAQNSFGAKIGNNYRARLRYLPEEKTWQLLSLVW
jgi:zinc-ribbon domain